MYVHRWMLARFTEQRERHEEEANSWLLLYALLACVSDTSLQKQLESSPLERTFSHLEVGEMWVGEEQEQAKLSELHFICVRWQIGSSAKEMFFKKWGIPWRWQSCVCKNGWISPASYNKDTSSRGYPASGVNKSGFQADSSPFFTSVVVISLF